LVSHAVMIESADHVNPVTAEPLAISPARLARLIGCPPRILAVGLYLGGPAEEFTPVHRKSQIYTDPSREEVVSISS
jgi:hypothetical protein